MKKLLLSLGTVASVAIPVTTVVSCGQTRTTKGSRSETFQEQQQKIEKLKKQTLKELKDEENSKVHDFTIQKNFDQLSQEELSDILAKIRASNSVEELKESVMKMLTETNINWIPKELAQSLVTAAKNKNEILQQKIREIEAEPITDDRIPVSAIPGYATTPTNFAHGTLPLTQEQKNMLSHYHVEEAVAGKQTRVTTLSPETTGTLEGVIKELLDEQNNFKITNTNLGAGRDFYKLPEKIILGGNKNGAELPNFQAPQGATLEFFKMVGTRLIPINRDNRFSIGEKDKVIIMVKKGNDWVNGKSYTPIFAAIPDQFLSFIDDGFGNEIKNGTFDMDSITDFVNTKLLPGQTYTSNLAGQTTSMLMPQLDASLRPANPQKGSTGRKVYSPFIDASMAQTNFDGSDASIDYVAKKYESVTMAFMQNGGPASDKAAGAWGGSVALNSRAANSYYKLMDAMRKNGHDFIVSFGGAAGSPIWKKADPVLLAGFLVNFADQYNINTFDYDIEGEVTDRKAIGTLSLATAIAQKALAKKGRTLNINLTIPSKTDGLAANGVDALKSFISSGVDINILNGMAMMMDPKITKDNGGLPGVYRNLTIDGLAKQLREAYADSNLDISDEELYGKIGITFDISTDTREAEKMHSNADLTELRRTFDDKKIGFIGYWSLNNDDDEIKGLGAPAYGVGKAYSHLHSFSDGTGSIPKVWNQDSNEFTERAFAAYYGNDSKEALADKDEVILPLGNKDSIPKGTKIKGIDHNDGTVHIYQSTYWAEGNQRPETPQSPTQFKDLGPESLNVKTTPAIKALLSQLSPFSVYGTGDDWSDIVTNLLTSGGSSVITEYDNSVIYNKPHTLVFYNGAFWTNYYQANPGMLFSPSQYGPWHKIS